MKTIKIIITVGLILALIFMIDNIESLSYSFKDIVNNFIIIIGGIYMMWNQELDLLISKNENKHHEQR